MIGRPTDKQIDRQTGIRTDRRANGQIDKQTVRQIDIETGRQKNIQVTDEDSLGHQRIRNKDEGLLVVSIDAHKSQNMF